MKIRELLEILPCDTQLEIKSQHPKIGSITLNWYGRADMIPSEYYNREILFASPFVNANPHAYQKFAVMKIILKGNPDA